jgi:RHS repeat-associated protein
VLANGDKHGVPASTNFAYYHCDQIGTPQEVTDESGELAWSARYRAWGEAKEVISEAARKAGITNPLRFAGQYLDRETNLHYNRHRYYDPSSGRFISKDPIGLAGGLNAYAYGGRNPVSLIDPLGLATYMCTQPLHALGAAGRMVYAPSSNPLYHQFIGIIRPDGTVITGGQDRAGGPWGPGKPSEGDGAPASGAECKKLEDDNECLEQCLIGKFAAPRPKYSLALQGFTGGQNCQGWSDSTLIQCQASCKAK